MQLTRNPELLDRLAACYALGTLRGGARRRFEAIARQSPTVRATTLLWHERLISITELQPSERPHENVWKRIENVIRGEYKAQPPAPVSAPARARGEGWWRMGALAGGFATLAAVTVALNLAQDGDLKAAELAQLRQQGTQLAQSNARLMEQVRAQPDIRYVAVLADDKASATMLALFDPKHNTLTLKRVGGYQEAADKSLQLWAITPGGPKSMGVLGGEAVVRLTAAEQQLQQAPALAISLEPKGGVPGEGGPTGPVLFKGAVLQTPI